MVKKKFWQDNRGESGIHVVILTVIIMAICILVGWRTWEALPEYATEYAWNDLKLYWPYSVALIVIIVALDRVLYRVQSRKIEERYRRDRELREAQLQASREAFDEATAALTPEQKTLLYGRLRSQNVPFLFLSKEKEKQPINVFCKEHGLPVNFEALGRVHYNIGRLEVIREDGSGTFCYLDLFGEDAEWFRQGRDYFQKRYEEEFEAITQNLSNEQKDGLKERIAGFSETYLCWSHIAYVWRYCLENDIQIKEEDERKLVRLYAQSQGYTGYVGVL